jgi:hypothetical protein
VTVNRKVGFDGVWRQGLLSKLSDAVRWNTFFLSSAGSCQLAPGSPLLFDIYVAESFRRLSKRTVHVGHTNNISNTGEDIQTTLNGLSTWACEHVWPFSTDQSQVNTKFRPPLNIGRTQLRFTATPKVTFYSNFAQLQFGAHTHHVHVKPVTASLKIMKALFGINWDSDKRRLHDLYVGYARPAGLDTDGVCFF